MTTFEKINELRIASINFLISRMKYRAETRDLDGHSVKYIDVSGGCSHYHYEGGRQYFYDNSNTLEDTIPILVMHKYYRSEETPVYIQLDDASPVTLIYEEPTNISGSGLSLYVYDSYTKQYGYIRFDDLCVENMDFVLSKIL